MRGSADAAQRAKPVWAVVTWVIVVLFFAPVAWMVLTSFHTESDAARNPRGRSPV
ncbi:hypothetical protein GCM10025868_20900 [Angustibacter aerolatus]|uniref:Sugar ABC transporter permease n=1 Tax=Angustibacter aerolatus TaxID=1162965 RepID=A0ABQ6JHY0_9ACTN|nr:hypothetical protein GCM10025868_20900 [Angustibacter aerolatus]